MADLSDNVIAYFRSAEDFMLDDIGMTALERGIYGRNRPGFEVSDSSRAYAAFNFAVAQAVAQKADKASFNHGIFDGILNFYTLSPQIADSLNELLIRAPSNSIEGIGGVITSNPYYAHPRYVDAFAASLEETAHSRIISSPGILHAILRETDKEKLKKLIAEEEFKARLWVLKVLNLFGIESYNTLWSQHDFDGGLRRLYGNDPHYDGYIGAERYFARHGSQAVDRDILLN